MTGVWEKVGSYKCICHFRYLHSFDFNFFFPALSYINMWKKIPSSLIHGEMSPGEYSPPCSEQPEMVQTFQYQVTSSLSGKDSSNRS